MNRVILIVALLAALAPAVGQNPPPLVPVDDVSKLANPANRTIEKSPLPKNLVPEQTPSGMIIYRKPLAAPNPAAQPKPRPPTAMTPEEVKMFRDAEQRARERNKTAAEPAPTPPISSAPPPKPPPEISADKEESCKKLGPFARAVADARRKGVPLRTAEAGTEILLGKQTTPDGLDFTKSIVRSVYANRLTVENAEEVIVGSCKILVYVSELEKNRK